MLKRFGIYNYIKYVKFFFNEFFFVIRIIIIIINILWKKSIVFSFEMFIHRNVFHRDVFQRNVTLPKI